jgi:hypothetical protein
MFDPRDVIAITGGEKRCSDKFNCQRKENWRDDNEMPLARHDRKSSSDKDVRKIFSSWSWKIEKK